MIWLCFSMLPMPYTSHRIYIWTNKVEALSACTEFLNSLQALKASTLFVQHSSRGKQRKGKRVCLWGALIPFACVCVYIHFSCVCICICICICLCNFHGEGEANNTKADECASRALVIRPASPCLFPLASCLLPCLLRTLSTMAAPTYCSSATDWLQDVRTNCLSKTISLTKFMSKSYCRINLKILNSLCGICLIVLLSLFFVFFCLFCLFCLFVSLSWHHLWSKGLKFQKPLFVSIS